MAALKRKPLDLGPTGSGPGANFVPDAVVVCEGISWRVHKRILCQRSPWFKAAFAGGFQEEREGKVTVNSIRPDLLGLFLWFIYTGEVDLSEYQHPEGGQDGPCVQYICLWDVGNFFLHRGFCELALRGLNRQCGRLTAHFALRNADRASPRSAPSAAGSDLTRDDLFDDYAEAVRFTFCELDHATDCQRSLVDLAYTLMTYEEINYRLGTLMRSCVRFTRVLARRANEEPQPELSPSVTTRLVMLLLRSDGQLAM